MTDTPIYYSGEGNGNTFDVGNGQGITPEALGYVHIESKRLIDAMSARVLNATIDFTPSLTPQTKIVNGQDEWIVQAAHHIIHVREGGGVGRSTVELTGLPDISLEDIYRANPPPWNGLAPPQANETPGNPKMYQWKGFRETRDFGLMPAFNAAPTAERNRLIAGGVYTDDGEYDIDWRPDSSFLYIIVVPDMAGLPLTSYELTLDDGVGTDEHLIVPNPPNGPHVVVFENVLVTRDYRVTVKATNGYGSSVVVNTFENVRGEVLGLPTQLPELETVGYIPRRYLRVHHRLVQRFQRATVLRAAT